MSWSRVSASYSPWNLYNLCFIGSSPDSDGDSQHSALFERQDVVVEAGGLEQALSTRKRTEEFHGVVV